MEFKHKPVLLDEVIDGLAIKPNGIYIDCTMGGGGHSNVIASHLICGKLIGFDRDLDAVKVCKDRFKNDENIEVIKANYKDAPSILKEMGINKIDGVLIDLGVSSYQIDNGERGFSFLHEGRLDMRMDRDQSLTAFDVVNTYSKERLLEILYKYGEEDNARKIVENIIAYRNQMPIETTTQLRDIIEQSYSKKLLFGKGGVSKKTFQAIRIEVNGELSGLEECLKEFVDMLNDGGRMAVITFHSLEDRIVKNVFKDCVMGCICPPKTPICICNHKAKGVLVSRKPITASEKELEENSRSSSAKLRIFERK